MQKLEDMIRVDLDFVPVEHTLDIMAACNMDLVGKHKAVKQSNESFPQCIIYALQHGFVDGSVVETKGVIQRLESLGDPVGAFIWF